MELLIAVAVLGLMVGLSITSYLGYVEKARVASAVAELSAIARLLDAIEVDDRATLPPTLAEIGEGDSLDPWGNHYQYLPLSNLPKGVTSTPGALPPVAASAPGGPAISEARKDGFLVPINSDFDLYSMGRDGESRASLRAPVSRDDVIRAADGSYFGLAERY